MRRVGTLLLSLACSLAGAAAFATPAQALDNGVYVIRDLATGSCLTPGTRNTAIGGVPAVLGACTRWRVENERPGQATLVDLTSSGRDQRCLDRDVPNKLIVYPCIFPQQWLVPTDAAAPTKLRNVETGLCATIVPGSSGTLQPCDTATTWRFEPVPPGGEPCPPDESATERG
ncbi:hypothetical protein ABH930_007326 [Kitasatospora sp. GAS204A]|uniref:RICIN domain-containing protein n=1 Tax=unclassified Kitasatospora TaxID=2633591 RepID=UPI00247472D7|nr:hypothetical protein [Kitasatospora sp. GAS204B]MDH6122942.1 hypothetical protein [Kitasatospora sp. GAS204B]